MLFCEPLAHDGLFRIMKLKKLELFGFKSFAEKQKSSLKME